MLSLLLGFILLGLAVSSPALKSIQDLKIIGGEDIDITEAPYQVSVVYRGRHSCGGAIIANDMIVTAAHCVVGTQAVDYQVRVGSSSNTRGGYLYPVGDLIWNPNFSYYRMDNDIALLWLSIPLVFSVSVAQVKLYDFGEEIDDGELAVVTGWGYTREGGGYPSMLQKVLVPKVNERACYAAYSPLYTISPRMLCAGIPQGGKDACQGDSGGPLVHNDKLAGIISWGLGCARPNYPGVYAKISALRSWLDENITSLRLKHLLRATQ